MNEKVRIMNRKDIHKNYLIIQIYAHLHILNVQILSKDSVTVAVDAVVYYRVFNPTVAIANVENFR